MTTALNATKGILIVSATLAVRRSLSAKLQSSSWNTYEAESGADALEKLELAECKVLLLDPRLPDLQLAEFKNLLRVHYPEVFVVDVHPITSEVRLSSDLPEAIRRELFQFLKDAGSVRTPAVEEQFSASPTSWSPELRNTAWELPGVIGCADNMQKVCQMARLVAQRDTTVLITGESGTGKDVIARAIHQVGKRAKNPFVVVNCAAIPESLLEAELFGFAKGAFTGAVQSRIGRIHAAQGGTLFLDEIGEMPLSLQSKLLRFLEQGEVQRLGSTDVFRVDVRVITATNANLRGLINSQRFREDLFYRVSVFPIDVPPLRERLSDLPVLAEYFVEKLCNEPVRLSDDAMDRLKQHNWPGNVRELRNVIERACILIGQNRRIEPENILL